MVEEFTVAVDSAHTQIFSTHLQKQLKDLQGYIDKHSNELDKHSQRILDEINKKIQSQVQEHEKNYKSLLDRYVKERDELDSKLHLRLNEIEKNYDKQLDRYVKERDELDRKLHLQLSEIEKNYDKQLAVFERQKRDTIAEFNEKINNIADVTAKPIQAVQKVLSNQVEELEKDLIKHFNGVHSEISIMQSTLLDEVSLKTNNLSIIAKENQNVVNGSILKLSNDVLARIDHTSLTLSNDVLARIDHTSNISEESFKAIENKLRDRLDKNDLNVAETLKTLLEEKRRDRKYLWGPLLFSVFLILILFVYLNIHSITKIVSK